MKNELSRSKSRDNMQRKDNENKKGSSVAFERVNSIIGETYVFNCRVILDFNALFFLWCFDENRNFLRSLLAFCHLEVVDDSLLSIRPEIYFFMSPAFRCFRDDRRFHHAYSLPKHQHRSATEGRRETARRAWVSLPPFFLSQLSPSISPASTQSPD